MRARGQYKASRLDRQRRPPELALGFPYARKAAGCGLQRLAKSLHGPRKNVALSRADAEGRNTRLLDTCLLVDCIRMNVASNGLPNPTTTSTHSDIAWWHGPARSPRPTPASKHANLRFDHLYIVCRLAPVTHGGLPFHRHWHWLGHNEARH